MYLAPCLVDILDTVERSFNLLYYSTLDQHTDGRANMLAICLPYPKSAIRVPMM